MAMRPKLMADGAAGKVAVFMVDENNPADRAPLDDPHSHLARVLFHSDLLYPIIIGKQSGTLNLPSRSANQDIHVVAHTLFAHGLAGQPLVFGRLTNIGNGTVPLAGSVPVQTLPYGEARWLSLGADATNVKITEMYHTHRNLGLSAISVNWEVWLTNLFLDRENPLPEPSGALLYIDGTSFKAGRGKFDATNRYLRTAATNGEFFVVKGRSIAINPLTSSGVSMWRYSVGGYVQQHTTYDGGNLGDSPATPLDFYADVVAVRTE